MKKTLVSALTTALVVGAASTTFAAANPFADVPVDHWAYESVNMLQQNGIVEGYTSGEFMGNSTMTRYEMAQIVAKAMTKLESADEANKARIDKLAAEFSDELANLGVRVAALEEKVDNVRWSGWMRYQYKYTNEDNTPGGGIDQQQVHLRMNIAMKINDNWTAYSRIKSDHYMNTNESSTPGFDRAWVRGSFKNFTVDLGKYEAFSNATHGMLLDSEISGGQVAFGKNVKFALLGGRVNYGTPFGGYTDEHGIYHNHVGDKNATVWGAEVRYVANKFDIGATYLQYRNVGDSFLGQKFNEGNGYMLKDTIGVWGVGVGYKFDDKWSLTADYARSGDMLENHKDNYRFEVKYGNHDAQKPGSWNVALQYRKRGYLSAVGNQGDWAASWADRGWALITNITLDKNIITELAYYRGKNFDTSNSNTAFWGQLQFIF